MTDAERDLQCPVCGYALRPGQEECPNCGSVIEVRQAPAGQTPAEEVPVEPASEAPPKRLRLSLKTVQAWLEQAQERERQNDIAGALEIYQRALDAVKAVQKKSASFLAMQSTLELLVRRMEQLQAQPRPAAPPAAPPPPQKEAVRKALPPTQPGLPTVPPPAAEPAGFGKKRAELPPTQPPPLPARKVPVQAPQPIRPEAARPAGQPRRRIVAVVLAALVLLLACGLGIGVGLRSGGRLVPALFASRTPTSSPTPPPTLTQPPTVTPSLTASPTLTPSLTITLTPTPRPIPVTYSPGATQNAPIDGATLVYVPEGKFDMGSNEGAPDSYPVHRIWLDAFWIDKTEVTNAMYAACVQAGGCYLPLVNSSKTRKNYYGDEKFARYPVVYVTWEYAAAYCKWAGRRLPTEAEWEKAARGTSDTRYYPWGIAAPSCQLVNYWNCTGDTQAVGSYPAGASPYGALDMAGNVWEWVNDWYVNTYYKTSPEDNPHGPATGYGHVDRGGGWGSTWDKVRVYARANQTDASWSIGFRCAQSAAP